MSFWILKKRETKKSKKKIKRKIKRKTCTSIKTPSRKKHTPYKTNTNIKKKKTKKKKKGDRKKRKKEQKKRTKRTKRKKDEKKKKTLLSFLIVWFKQTINLEKCVYTRQHTTNLHTQPMHNQYTKTLMYQLPTK